MDKKISQLTAATTPLTGAEELAIVQSGVTKKTTIEDVKGYKVYTALLTQSGGDNPSPTFGDETLGKGLTYTIVNLEAGDNLIPYGAPNNDVGTSFVCNQDVGSWGNPLSTLSVNSGAPVVTVLENTIGNIWFTYYGVGSYYCQSNGLFTSDKTTLSITQNYANGAGGNGNFIFYQCYQNNQDVLAFTNIDVDLTGATSPSADGLLNNTPIEIRVYN